MLFDTAGQAFRLSFAVVLPVALVVGATVLVLVSRALKARRAPRLTGVDAMVGTGGEVVTPLDPAGTVLVRGEYSDAVAPAPLSSGARVRVVGGSRRRLSVESAGAAPHPTGASAEKGGTA